MTIIRQRNFRYTFSKETLTNVGLNMEPGQYRFQFRKVEVVLCIDTYGEVRLANETPVNNVRRLTRQVRKAAGL